MSTATRPWMTEERANLDSVRRQLLAAVAKRDVSLAAASRAIGRNHSYLQQFVKRGTPRRLPEVVRHALANFLDVNERTLRPPDDWTSGADAEIITADRPELSSFVARLAVARAESPFAAPSAFAAAAGIDRWRYGELEEGDEQPTLDELDRIARAAGKGLDWLIGGAAERRPPAIPSDMTMRGLSRQGQSDRPALSRPPKIIDDV